MPVNDKQKIILVNIDAAAQAFIETKLSEGYVIELIVNLQPSVNKLLIVYATPPEI